MKQLELFEWAEGRAAMDGATRGERIKAAVNEYFQRARRARPKFLTPRTRRELNDGR